MAQSFQMDLFVSVLFCAESLMASILSIFHQIRATLLVDHFQPDAPSQTALDHREILILWKYLDMLQTEYG